MKKNDKKIENRLRITLTNVCETALKDVAGFKWLTHLVNYNDFPNSLLIICIFDTNHELANARENEQDEYIRYLIQCELTSDGIKLISTKSQIKFDTEENCTLENNGCWSERLK